MNEREIDAESVRREHLQAVHQPAQWAYLVGVLAGGTLVMLGLIAGLAGIPH